MDSNPSERVWGVTARISVATVILAMVVNFYTTAKGISMILDVLPAIIAAFAIVAILSATSWLLAGDLSKIGAKRPIVARGWLSAIIRNSILLSTFLVNFGLATFFSFATYLTIFSASFGAPPTELGRAFQFERVLEALQSGRKDALIGLTIVVLQNLYVFFAKLVFEASVTSGTQLTSTSEESSKSPMASRRGPRHNSLVGRIANRFRVQAIALAILAGLGSIYCFFTLNDARVLAFILLGCALWGAIDVLLMSRRMASGQYGDADFELRELVVPLVTRIRNGADPGDPDRLFPIRAVEQTAEVPSGLAARI